MGVSRRRSRCHPRTSAERIMDMTSLCGTVLALNEEATDLDMEATLRARAIRYTED